MEKENKMSLEVKEESNKLEVKKEYRVNIKYIEFINKVIVEKLGDSNKESLEKEYEKLVNLRSSNIDRVKSRVMRKEVKEVVSKFLKDNYNLEYNYFGEISNLVCEKIGEKKNSKYLKV